MKQGPRGGKRLPVDDACSIMNKVVYERYLRPLKQKGFLMVYNPTKEKIEKTINVPLYYTGWPK